MVAALVVGVLLLGLAAQVVWWATKASEGKGGTTVRGTVILPVNLKLAEGETLQMNFDPEDAGVGRGALQPALPERVLTGLLNVAGKAFPMARVIDSSPYDRRMRRFHNWMKDTPSFQQPPYERFSFAPWSAWMVLTDGVSHACIEGQHALVDTFLIPLRNCRRPAPYHLLAGAA